MNTKKWQARILMLQTNTNSNFFKGHLHECDVTNTNSSKIPFTPKGGRLSESNFLRHLDLCYVDLAYHKLKIFPLL